MSTRDRLYVKERDKAFYTAWIVKNVKNVKLPSSSTARTVKNVQSYIAERDRLYVKERDFLYRLDCQKCQTF